MGADVAADKLEDDSLAFVRGEGCRVSSEVSGVGIGSEGRLSCSGCRFKVAIEGRKRICEIKMAKYLDQTRSQLLSAVGSRRKRAHVDASMISALRLDSDLLLRPGYSSHLLFLARGEDPAGSLEASA